MRLLVLLLLLLNAGLFAWQYQRERGAAETEDAVSGNLVSGAERDVPTLVLLREREEMAGEQAVAMSPPEPVAPVPEAPGRCVEIGPLEDRAVAEALLTAAGHGAVTARLREAGLRVPAGRWVRLPQAFSLPAARGALRALAEKGVRDISIVPLATGEYAVSLGVFSRADTMGRRLDEIRALGYDPIVVDRHAVQTVYYLDVELPGGDDAVLQALRERVAGSAPPSVHLSETGCDEAGDEPGAAIARPAGVPAS